MPQKDFCEQRGINYKTFANWRSRNNAAPRRTAKRTVKVSRKESPHPLIPLQVIEADAGHPLPKPLPEVNGSAPSPITIITSSGDRLLITDGFD
ncbi:IS66 family insertion sequence element accessory protein TnpA [Comamonas fluminis]|uniref:IS66 family insertion sequence element accessory protein TnpA n=1 Tax=Comamonas fluminis TaxID=2796366 RepID=UPI003CCE7B6F